jgi:hypothetical protein
MCASPAPKPEGRVEESRALQCQLVWNRKLPETESFGKDVREGVDIRELRDT